MAAPAAAPPANDILSLITWPALEALNVRPDRGIENAIKQV